MHYFDGYFAIDWSGDKNRFQKGIKIAFLDAKNSRPEIISPINNEKYWNRNTLIEYLKNLKSNKRYLIGFDFAFSYPFQDYKSYFFNLEKSPLTPNKLWDFIDTFNIDDRKALYVKGVHLLKIFSSNFPYSLISN